MLLKVVVSRSSSRGGADGVVSGASETAATDEKENSVKASIAGEVGKAVGWFAGACKLQRVAYALNREERGTLNEESLVW